VVLENVAISQVTSSAVTPVNMIHLKGVVRPAHENPLYDNVLNSTLDIRNSHFSRCLATGSFIFAENANVTVLDSTFEYMVGSYGGAFSAGPTDFVSGFGSLSVRRSTFFRNVGGLAGGFGSWVFGELDVSDSTFSENRAQCGFHPDISSSLPPLAPEHA
jgi:hypothetical protein